MTQTHSLPTQPISGSRGRKHAVIVAHPRARSVTCAAAGAFAEAARAAGDQVIVRDLYRMRFDPCLKAEEIPHPKGYAFG